MAIRFASTKEIVEASIKNYNDRLVSEAAEEKRHDDVYHENINKFENIVTEGTKRNRDANRRSSFFTSAKSSLLIDAISNIVEGCLDKSVTRAYSNANDIARSLVSEYVNENGVDDILRKMNHSGPLMYETARIVNKYYKQIVNENVDVAPEDLSLNPELKDKFYEELEISDTDSVTEQIRQRVADSIQNWMYRNAEEKEEIKSILDKAGETMAKYSDDEEEVQESYSQIAKQRINKIRNRDHSLFHNLVEGMCKIVLKNPEYQEAFMNEGKLDMDSIVNNCKITYTFMEAMASLKIADRETLAEQMIEEISNK
jgi:hypothetical protein